MHRNCRFGLSAKMHAFSRLLLTTIVGLSGCITAQSWQEGACEESEDCRPWQACREGICIKDATTVACDILADDCGVGQTCMRDADYGFSYCAKRPLRIGYLQQAAPNGSKLPTYTSDYFDYVLNTTELTELFALGTEDWSFELIEYTYDVENQEESLPAATAAMMEDDLDIILTMTSSRYANAVSLNQDRHLILGVYNRRADVVLEELEAQKADGYPDIDQRFDFSIAPIQYNDQATIGHYLSTRDLCQTVTYTIAGNNDTERVRLVVGDQEMRRHSMCTTRFDFPGLADGMTPEDLLEDFAALDREGSCILVTGEGIQLLADYIDLTRARGATPQAQILMSLSQLNATGAELYPSLLDESWRDHFIAISYVTAKDDTGMFEAELFVETRYRDVHDYHCSGDAADAAPCTFGFPYTDFRTPALLIDGNGGNFFLNYRRDLLTLALLTAYRARLRFGEGFSREQLRDSFLAIIEHEPDHTPCDRDSIEDCFSRLRARREVRFDGSSSPMKLGEDGRMLRLYETMILDRMMLGPEFLPDPSKRVTYSGKEMLANHQKPIDDALTCSPDN